MESIIVEVVFVWRSANSCRIGVGVNEDKYLGAYISHLENRVSYRIFISQIDSTHWRLSLPIGITMISFFCGERKWGHIPLCSMDHVYWGSNQVEYMQVKDKYLGYCWAFLHIKGIHIFSEFLHNGVPCMETTPLILRQREELATGRKMSEYGILENASKTWTRRWVTLYSDLFNA